MAIDKGTKALELARELRKRLRRQEKLVFEHATHMSFLYNRTESLAESLEDLQEKCDGGNGNSDANFFWPADKEKLDAELANFAAISDETDELAFSQQTPDMQAACNAFQDYLVGRWDDIELVNFQDVRHGYENPDRAKHADAIVILVNPANPAEDKVVDLCREAKLPGTLYGKLQFLIVGETPW